MDRKQDYGRLFEEKSLPLSRIIILQGKYLVTPGKEGLTVVNIRRARERILYERFLGVLSKEGHITQVSLFPVTVQVGVENRLVFDAHGEELRKLGFDITPFGNDTVVVNGVPEGFSNPAEMFYVKPDHFFAMPLYCEKGTLMVDGRAIKGPEGQVVKSKSYLDGPVG